MAKTHVKHNGTWKEVAGTGGGGKTITGITIDSGPTQVDQDFEDYTVVIDFDDGTTSTDPRLLDWEWFITENSDQKYTNEHPRFSDITSTTVTVDWPNGTGTTSGNVDYKLRASDPNSTVFGELDIDLICVPVDTPVLMADGAYKPLGEIEQGDMVRAVNPETGEISDQPVAFVLKRSRQKDLVTLSLGDGRELRATPEHPVWAKRGDTAQWLRSDAIQVGDKLMTEEIEWVEVEKITTDGDTHEVMNLEVANEHVYIANGVLLHNN